MSGRRVSLGVVDADPLARLRRALAGLEREDVAAQFGLPAHDQVLKTTISLCPTCLAHVPAVVYTAEGRVWLERRCPEHGGARALLESDERYYHLSNKDASGRCYAPDRVMVFPEYQDACCGPSGCGPATSQAGNKTCTILVEVTNACNLSCAVCYSDSKGDRMLPLETFKQHIDALIETRGGLDSVQITGGEATLHPDYWSLVGFLADHAGVGKVYLPTNGLLLSQPDGVAPLEQWKDKVLVLLQFDALDAAANLTLRRANPDSQRRRLVEACGVRGIPMQLTMTLSHGVNTDQLEAVLRFALARNHVKVLALQPVTWSGRYDLPEDPLDRLTLSDIVKTVAAAETRARSREADFAPIPCSHPNCGWISLYVRRFGLVRSLMPHVDLERVMNSVAYKTMLSSKELQAAVGTAGGPLRRAIDRLGRKLVRSSDVFTVAVKPFMDRFTYDQDRIAACCHHLMDTRGQAVSFCEYNARLREADSWERFPVA